MKNIISTIAFLVLITSVYSATLKLDPVHSNLGFTIGHLGVSEIKGTFKMNEGTIIMKGEDFADAEISMTMDMKSVDTDNDKRDDHLRTPDFFDAVKYPEGKFKSTSCKKSADQKYILTGDLTMHGLTKQVTLVMLTKSGINPTNNKPIYGIKVTGTIKRTDFDISAATPDAVITNDVAIEANMEFSNAE